MKFFRFLSRTIPEKFSIKTKDYKNEPVYTQASKDEMEQFNLTNLPLYLDHDHDIEVSVKEKGKPITVKSQGKSVLGRVVDKFVTDQGSMMTLVEIPLDDDVTTDEGRALNNVKNTVVELIKMGHVGSVSFCHTFDKDHYPEYNIEFIKKMPLELSLTRDPDREGSDILQMYYSETPYLPTDAYKAFNVYDAVAKSGVDFGEPTAIIDNNNNNNNLIQEKEKEEEQKIGRASCRERV